MQTRFDQYAKAVLREALSPSGKVHSEHEIAVAPQRADVYFEPSPQRSPPSPGADAWVLRRIDDLTCLLEHFRETPDLHEVRRCVRKLLSLHHLQCLEARKQGLPPPPLPELWLLSPGLPEGATDGLALTPRLGWPSGFLDGPPALGLHLVVLRELPPTRETLVLRLLAPGPTFDAALEELKRLPPDALECRVVLPHLLAWRIVTMNDLHPMMMDRLPLTPTLEEIYAKWQRKVEDDARRSILSRLLRQRFGAVPDTAMARIEAAERPVLERWTDRVLIAATLDEVLDEP